MLLNLRKIFLILFFFLLTGSVKAQVSDQGRDFLLSVYDHYKSIENFQFSTSYNLYKGFKSELIVETYSGVYYKSNESIYQKIGQVEVLQTQNMVLKIDHKSKVMQLSDPQVSFVELLGFKLDDFLSSCDTVLMKHDKNGGYVCSFHVKPFTGSPYSSIEIYMGSDLSIKKFVYYLSNKMDFSKKFNEIDMNNARLEVEFSNFSKELKQDNTKIDFKDFIYKENREIKPISKYANYRLYVNAKKPKI